LHDDPAVVGAVFVGDDARRFTPVVRSLREATDAQVVLGGPSARAFSIESDSEVLPSGSIGGFIQDVFDRWKCHVLLVGEPILAPRGLLDWAQPAMDADPRVATVSFLSNAAGLASFPHRGAPLAGAISGHDAETLTQCLRSRLPVVDPVPIPVASGAIALVSAWVLGAVHDLMDSPGETVEAFLAELSLQGRRRGFIDLLDTMTFVQHAGDLARPDERGSLAGDERDWVFRRHPFARALIENEAQTTDSPFANAHSVSRAKVLGLRVLLDGSCLGPTEMGTQVGLVALTAALAARDDVSDVRLAVPGQVPSYAAHLLSLPKVSMKVASPGADLVDFGSFDVAYRSFQPDAAFSVRNFRSVAKRVVVGILDLIAYQIGAYHTSGEDWLHYRETIREVVRLVDGITTISDDVRSTVGTEQLPIDASRVFAIPYGTQHLTGLEALRMPTAFPESVVASRFLLCLGTNYTHKNRDLAIRTHRELLSRGHRLGLVLVGASVPAGSSRVAEAEAMAPDPSNVVFLPDVSSEERNWLLSHASAVLYPTSAEGFGLVPYEAAWFGTPTVFVPFGPLREIGGSLPVEASDWRPESLADAAERLLADPDVARRHVESLVESSERFTWAAHAAALVDAFRAILLIPNR
jgi:glycosyltransferase involved in cell wall biosynthesis